jgi:hypothetical protein
MVRAPVRRRAPMTGVSAGGHRSGCVSGPQLRGGAPAGGWGSVLGGEGDVPDLVQGLDGPAPSDRSGELSRAACSAMRLVTA